MVFPLGEKKAHQSLCAYLALQLTNRLSDYTDAMLIFPRCVA